ncbi:hypothetical protein [uncultured Microscilla sp.]|uniref:hypothetical protein n=1 Tax=uncultured Microscilla sp. TaxID=432653 RepID=UPI002612646D|nr:hypothetical protein [uncultured Microscilla sp.]
MSEFQFYGFRSIDRNLSKEEQRKIGSLSSRTTPSSNSATFVYHYGNFPANEEAILEQYFDVMLYYANWGTRKVMFRLPIEAANYEDMVQYQQAFEDSYDNGVSIFKKGAHVIVKVEFNDEPDDYGEDPEEYFQEMTQWRQLLMDGDNRLLFLAWLHTQSLISLDEEYEDHEENSKSLPVPHIPHNITSLQRTLKDFVNFFNISPDWINAAANLVKQSPAPPDAPSYNYVKLIEQLPEATKNKYLYKLLHQEVNLHLKLKNDLEELSGVVKPTKKLSKWTTEDLYNEVQEAKQETKRRAKKQAEEQARKKLVKLVADEPQLWKDTIFNIERFDRKGYENATKNLKALLKVAKHLDKLDEYTTKLENIKANYSSKRSLIAMLKEIVY